MKFPIFETGTGQPMGEKEIPDDVIEAARKVLKWMQSVSYGERATLCGLTLADRNDPVIRSARLLRAAVEDANLLLNAIPRDAMTFNQAAVAAQVKINISSALMAATYAGITRAETIQGDA